MNGENYPTYGKSWTDEQRAKIRKHLKANGGSMKGKKHSEETKEKMRAAALARIKRAKELES